MGNDSISFNIQFRSPGLLLRLCGRWVFDRLGFIENEGATTMRYALTIAALLFASQTWAQQAPPINPNPTRPNDPTYRAPGTPTTDTTNRTGTFRDQAARPHEGTQKIVRAS